MRKTIAFWATVLFSWSWSGNPGDSNPSGFKIMIGNASGQYTQTIDVPGGDKRSYSASLDTSKALYARMVAYSDWATSVPSDEVTFGGGLTAKPTVFTVKPANP